MQASSAPKSSKLVSPFYGISQDNFPLCSPTLLAEPNQAWAQQDVNGDGTPETCRIQDRYGYTPEGDPICSSAIVDENGDGWGIEDTNKDGILNACVVSTPKTATFPHFWGINETTAKPYCSPQTLDLNGTNWASEDTDGIDGPNDCITTKIELPPTHKWGINADHLAPNCNPETYEADGWGWEDTDNFDGPNSCRIIASAPVHDYGIHESSGKPYCSPEYYESDGWGLQDTDGRNGLNVCRVQASATIHNWGFDGDQNLPLCAPDHYHPAGLSSQDTDNDGRNNACVVQAKAPQDTATLASCINMGNALEAENEGDWGYTIEDKHLKVIADAQFDAIRVPIKWSAHAGKNYPYTIDATFFERTDHVIDTAIAQGLTVIIDVHHYTEFNESPADHTERLKEIWKQISERYANHSEKLVFEIFNEGSGQATPKILDALNADLVKTIRQKNPDRRIILATGLYGGLDGMLAGTPPIDDKIMASFHYYEPYCFTHQLAAFAAESTAHCPAGPLTFGEEEQKAKVRDDIAAAAAYGQKHNIPVFMGEFGVFGGVPINQRKIWTEFIRQEAEDAQISWCNWDFAAAFNAYDNNRDKWLPDILEALKGPLPATATTQIIQANSSIETNPPTFNTTPKTVSRYFDSTKISADDFDEALYSIRSALAAHKRHEESVRSGSTRRQAN
ncbi:glycoside hydrolase family 5 protein [Hirschia litorea]|uniref:Glycoside hydrolase family 5 protein n=1 Tax=Hirschia litorea TaxID=1199156 RepID=A0ABW2IID1_9PROT